jgi:uncharacterized RDD family membrane protein YckC
MSLSEETLNIDTPENVAFGYDIAGLGSRFLATLIDTLALGGLVFVLSVGLLVIANLADASLADETLGYVMLGVISLATFAIFWGYYIFFESAWNGQTPGKRVLGLRVIRTDGAPISLSEAVIRNLVRIIDLLPSAYGLGVVAMFINSQSRRLGDLAAGTLVVHDQAPVELSELMEAHRPAVVSINPQAEENTLPIERLSAQELHVLEDYLRRKDKLHNRVQLSEQLAGRLHARLGLPEEFPPTWPDSDTLIVRVLEAQRIRSQAVS